MIIADPRELLPVPRAEKADSGIILRGTTDKWPPMEYQGARTPGAPETTNPSWLMERPSLDREAEEAFGKD